MLVLSFSLMFLLPLFLGMFMGPLSGLFLGSGIASLFALLLFGLSEIPTVAPDPAPPAPVIPLPELTPQPQSFELPQEVTIDGAGV